MPELEDWLEPGGAGTLIPGLMYSHHLEVPHGPWWSRCLLCLCSCPVSNHFPLHPITWAQNKPVRGKGRLLSIVKMREVRQCCSWVSKVEMRLTLRNSSPPLAPFLPLSLPLSFPPSLPPSFSSFPSSFVIQQIEYCENALACFILLWVKILIFALPNIPPN